MRRNQQLGFPGLGHSQKVLSHALREATAELAAIRRVGVSKVRGGKRLIKSLEVRIADLHEGKGALRKWVLAEVDG